MKTILIINPASGNGSALKHWKEWEMSFRIGMPDFETFMTTKRGDATTKTREALLNHYDQIVACGGDGTVNECVNGFFGGDGQPINRKASLGILPLGRGCDFARSLKIPRDPLKAFNLLCGKKTRQVDVGLVECHDFHGKKISRYFINVANVGVVPHVVNWAHRAPRLGSMGSYVYGAVRGALEYTAFPVEYSTANGHQRSSSIINAVIANGPYFGSNMKIAPKAQVDDGVFDILLAPSLNIFKFLALIPKFYFGTHMKSKNLEYSRLSYFEIKPKHPKYALSVETDGDTIGLIPAKFSIIPQAIAVKV